VHTFRFTLARTLLLKGTDSVDRQRRGLYVAERLRERLSTGRWHIPAITHADSLTGFLDDTAEGFFLPIGHWPRVRRRIAAGARKAAVASELAKETLISTAMATPHHLAPEPDR